jgi:hypothetical protein
VLGLLAAGAAKAVTSIDDLSVAKDLWPFLAAGSAVAVLGGAKILSDRKEWQKYQRAAEELVGAQTRSAVVRDALIRVPAQEFQFLDQVIANLAQGVGFGSASFQEMVQALLTNDQSAKEGQRVSPQADALQVSLKGMIELRIMQLTSLLQGLEAIPEPDEMVQRLINQTRTILGPYRYKPPAGAENPVS